VKLQHQIQYYTMICLKLSYSAIGTEMKTKTVHKRLQKRGCYSISSYSKFTRSRTLV